MNLAIKKTCDVGEISRGVFPNNLESQLKLYGYLLACRQLNTTDYFNSETYKGKKLYIFKDAHDLFTAIYDNEIIIYGQSGLENMLLDVDMYIFNVINDYKKVVKK